MELEKSNGCLSQYSYTCKARTLNNNMKKIEEDLEKIFSMIRLEEGKMDRSENFSLSQNREPSTDEKRNSQ